MRLLDYFIAPLFYLLSPLPIEECARRINTAAGSVLVPFQTGVTGFVWMSGVHLRHRGALIEFGTKPVLTGRIDPMHGGTRFKLRYRAPMPAYFAAALAFPMLILALWVISVSAASADFSVNGPLGLLAVAAMILVLPVLIFLRGATAAEAGREELLRFLAQHVQTRPIAGEAR